MNNFISKANSVHKNKYNYDKSIYENSNLKIKIECVEHGYFMQTPSNHLKGQGCPKCGRIKGDKNRLLGLNRFIEKAKEIHDNKYIYDNTVYEKSHLKLEILCLQHGPFKQSPYKHLRGKGCPRCER